MRAVVDIGSNSVKFVLAEDQRDVPRIIRTGSKVTRLSQNLEQTGRLSPESIEVTQKALLGFREIFHSNCEASKLQCVVIATSAVRDCSNQEDVRKIVSEIFGVELIIASGIQEARISLEGGAAAGQIIFPHTSPLFIEIGGASTQISVLEPDFIAHSFQVGAVRAHERLGYQKRALSPVEIQNLERNVFQFYDLEKLESLKWAFEKNSKRACSIAIGGTLVLAARAAGAQKIDDCGFTLSCSDLRAFNQKLCTLPAEERKSLAHIDSGREDIIITGTAALLSLLDYFEIEKVGFSEWGLRHGALRMWDKIFPRINF